VSAGDVAQQLEAELVRVKSQLRATVEQHETQAEELKASNEELQAMNEELRSSAEELETSKEELQSLNEELRTVNQELKVKIEEQAQANDDIQNLINSTEIGTIFLDRSSRIELWTPRARDVFNVIPADRGRSLFDISHRLVDVDLRADVERVLDRLERVEREVQTSAGRWYVMHVLPYRTAEDRIDGAVVTFLDITDRRNAEARLRESENRLRLLVDSVSDYAIFTTDVAGRIDSWNPGAARMFGYAEDEAIGQPSGIVFAREDRDARVSEEEMRQAREQGRAIDERWHERKDGSRFYVSGTLTTLRDAGGTVLGYVKVARDLTERKRWEDTLQRAHSELEQRVAERTRDLEAANALLDKQLHERREAEQRVRRLLSRLVNVQEDERRRIARDLHDHLGQQMTAVRLKVELLTSLAEHDDQIRDRLKEAREIITRIDRDIDFLTWELRPAVLDDLGLVAALGNFVEEWSANYLIPADFHTSGLDSQRLGFEVETNLYRIAQEALNNVFKHAQATRADVMLERRDGELVLVIEDNGTGFSLPEAAGTDGRDRGLGLNGMQERAAYVGGSLEIETAPGHGTTVFVRVPLAPPSA
jgi:PAS domain S-box-containing protein